MKSAANALGRQLARLRRPVLVLSTAVGRGMVSLADALVERLGGDGVHHRAIEEFLPPAAVREDLERYKLISSRFPILLHLAYRLPPIYLRKLLRERTFESTDLGALGRAIGALGVRSVVSVSHRASFWVGCLKRRRRLEVEVAGLNGEYGSSLGWRYIFWRQIDAFWSPIPRSSYRFEIPRHVRFAEIELPVRQAYRRLADRPGDPSEVLVVCGYWGQGPILRVVRRLLEIDPGLRVHAVCGEDAAQLQALEAELGASPRVRCHGLVDSLAPILGACASVVTKPGISTLLEAHAAERKIFLLRGMPVAEDHNAAHARRHFGAEDFDPSTFSTWLTAARQGG